MGKAGNGQFFELIHDVKGECTSNIEGWFVAP